MKPTLAALWIAAALAARAEGFTLDEDESGHPLHWRRSDMPVPYRLATANVPGGETGESVIHAAARRWSEVSEGFALAFGGYVARPTWGRDGRNVVLWVDREWPFDETLIATTVRAYSVEDGRMVDADVLFNAETYRWTLGGESDRYDVDNTATHELGHIAGLGHSTEPEATMFGSSGPGETKKRTLEEDDRQGLLALYPAGAPLAAAEGALGADRAGGGGGGCSIGRRPAADAASVPFAAALLALAIRARGRRRPGRRATLRAGGRETRVQEALRRITRR